ncbi:hypothetical protein IMZ48_01645 [Candidatus Bathyarchaeota archaeon]|nr:hypothetical protein [Candidatus Bathyarchaeota archaeon]
MISLTITSYLEAGDTIFNTLPPTFSVDHPPSPHSFFVQNPHPFTHSLQSISLFSDWFSPHGYSFIGINRATPPRVSYFLPRGNYFSGPPEPSGPDTTQWRSTLAALALLPALREVRLAIRFDPAGDHDLRPLARIAGAKLAAKFIIDLSEDEDREAPCRKCTNPPGRFIVPAANAAEGAAKSDGEDCPPFGRVTRHELRRYFIHPDHSSPEVFVVRTLDRKLCISCNEQGPPSPYVYGRNGMCRI